MFGHAEAVQLLLEQGADREAHGNDGRTVLEVVAAARAEERNAKTLTALDAVAAALRAPGSGR